MMQRLPGVMMLAILVGACTDTESATNLNPEGPPMIRQVLFVERYTDATDPNTLRSRGVIAFGTHPEAFPVEVNPSAIAVANNNLLRIVLDELLVGNNLEEIQCRGPVDEDQYARVPLGATPDDIARCSNTDDTLPASCSGSNPHSVCICQNPAGCFRGTTLVDKGQPVGVLDNNADGAVDDTRLIAGAVGVRCGTIDVPIDLNSSYWYPSGDQNKPAMGGVSSLGRFSALGPAIMVKPSGSLPTNLSCSLVFSDDVVDKQGEHVCAPPGGDIAAGCAGGDLAAFSFKVEPLAVPPADASFRDGAIGVPRMDPILLSPTAPLDPASLSAITIAPVVAITVTSPMPSVLRIAPPAGGFAANTMYTLTLPVGLRDAYQQPLPAPIVYRFTTGM